jgi:hypothetical protein
MSKVKFTEKELVGFIESIVENEISIPHQPILSESKNRRLVNWADRFERKNIGKSPDTMCENFVKDMHRLNKAGFTLDEISYSLKHNKKYLAEQSYTMAQNQGILGSLWGTIREKLWMWLLGTFGISGELGKFVGMALGNVPIWDIPKLLDCNYLAPFMTKGLIEYGAFKLGNATIGLDGTFEQVLRNSLTDIGDNSAIYREIEGKVKEVLCGKLEEKKKQVNDVIKDGERKDDEKTKYGTTVDVDAGDEEEPETSSVKSALGGIGDIFTKYMNKYKDNLGE